MGACCRPHRAIESRKHELQAQALSLLGDLTSLGVSLAFATVCVTVVWLRSTRPDLHRPFRVPLGGVWIGRVWFGWVPAGGIVLCLGMAVPVAIDIVSCLVAARA